VLKGDDDVESCSSDHQCVHHHRFRNRDERLARDGRYAELPDQGKQVCGMHRSTQDQDWASNTHDPHQAALGSPSKESALNQDGAIPRAHIEQVPNDLKSNGLQ
jgi:hypothetical protein